MATHTIRQAESIAIPGISRKNIERIGEFISAVAEDLRVHVGIPFGNYSEGKPPESVSPMEKAVFDVYRWGHLPI